MRSPTLLLLAGLSIGSYATPLLAEESDPPETSANADNGEDVFAAIRGGEFAFSLRLRHEFVDQDGVDHRANAYTGRLALSYQTAQWNDLQAGFGVQGTQRLWRQRYAAGPTAPRPGYPVVADPDGGNINQAWLRWTPHDDVRITVGRQRIIHDNARFIGNVGWRQTEQTFDAGRIQWEAPLGLEVDAGYLSTINTIFGTRQNLHGGFARVAKELSGVGTLVGFAYYYDYHKADALDLLTSGARFTGQQDLTDELSVHYAVAGAYQREVADNPDNISEYYLAAEGALGYSGFRATVGWERLSGNGEVAFETPLATKHAFNGWSDKFLGTPDAGLDDYYAGLGGPIPGVEHLSAVARFHWFRSVDASGPGDYGKEYNLQIVYKPKHLDPGLQFGVKGAFYDADGAFTDTIKTWTWIGYSF